MSMKKTHEQFVAEVKDLVGDEYEVLSQYKGAHGKVRFLHKICGTIFEQRANDFLGGHRCAVCKGGVVKSVEDFKEEFKKIMGDEYTLLTPYKNKETSIQIRHNTCGTIYIITPQHLKDSVGCPKCFGKKRGRKPKNKEEK